MRDLACRARDLPGGGQLRWETGEASARVSYESLGATADGKTHYTLADDTLAAFLGDES